MLVLKNFFFRRKKLFSGLHCLLWQVQTWASFNLDLGLSSDSGAFHLHFSYYSGEFIT